MSRDLIVERPGFWVRITNINPEGELKAKLMDLLSKVSSVSGYTKHQLTGKSRVRDLVEWRMAYTHLCLTRTNASLKTIARATNKDHSTIIHHRTVFNDMLEAGDKRFKDIFNKIKYIR